MTEIRMKPIWYFLGLMLMVMGILILGAGIFEVVNPPETKTVLSELRPGIWWGLVMVLFGGILYFRTRKGTS